MKQNIKTVTVILFMSNIEDKFIEKNIYRTLYYRNGFFKRKKKMKIKQMELTHIGKIQKPHIKKI